MPVIMSFVAHERIVVCTGFHRVSSCVSTSASTTASISRRSILRSHHTVSDVPHGEDDAVHVEEWHQGFGLAFGNGAAAGSVLLVAWTTLRTLSRGHIFVRSSAI